MSPADKPLLPTNWEELAPLVDQLLDGPLEERVALLGRLSEGDPARRAALEQLLAECERDLPLLDAAAVERFDLLAVEDPGASLPEVLGGRYRIERELGRGGMAQVYLAQDLKHARYVAVKVIRPELAASLGRDRFLREIGIAARLRHPNIMPLFDSGDADGVLYFVMPYEDGPSLRARLDRDHTLSINDAMGILREVARALAYAHEQGVVHRDVKPDNVMLSGGAAVVTDFGIAKAVSAAQSDGGTGSISRTGSVIGTPAYMAPEQAVGDPASDQRVDIYAFGCVAYELFTGKPPFGGSTTFEIIGAHLSSTPLAVTASRADVPGHVAELIAQCLQKDPAARPQSARQLLEVLESGSLAERTPIRRRWHPRAKLALAGVAVLLAAALWYFIPRGGPVTVAVLPFQSAGGDSVLVPLAEGYSEEIATALVKIPWLRVMSRSGVGNYSGQGNIDPRATGRALGAQYLVMGSLRELGGRQTVTVRLVGSDDEAVLWADQFDRPGELGVLRDRIVTTIGDSLHSRAGRRFRSQVVGARPAHHGSDEAYRLYLTGKRKLSQRGQSLGASIDLFRGAIALDTLSPEAYSGLSLALALSPYFQGVSAASVASEATAAAERALGLDPRLAEPHIALGLVFEEGLQWDRAGAEFRSALGLDAHDVEARVQYARYLLFQERGEEAMEQLRLAREDDPASAVVASWIAYSYFVRNRVDSALVESARAMQIDSLNMTTLMFRSLVLLAAGQPAEAHRLVLRGPPHWPVVLYVLAATGDRATALERVKLLSEARPVPWLAETATAFAMLGLGDTTRALDALERATEAKEIWPSIEPVNSPEFRGLRGSARFQALLARVGLLSK